MSLFTKDVIDSINNIDSLINKIEKILSILTSAIEKNPNIKLDHPDRKYIINIFRKTGYSLMAVKYGNVNIIIEQLVQFKKINDMLNKIDKEI